MKAKATSKTRLQGSAMAGGWKIRKEKPKEKKKGKDCEDCC